MGEDADVDGQEQMFPGANVSRLEDGDILASLSAWARVLGTERETLRRRLVDANVRSKGERRGHPVYGGRDVIGAWMSSPEARVDPDSMSPFNRRAWYQGDHEKLRLQEERGELVPALEVEQTIGKLAKLFTLGIETLIDVIERDVGLSAAQARCLEKHLDRLRENLYQALSEPSEPVESAPSEQKPRATPESTPAPTGSALEQAITFLEQAVAGGPQPTRELFAAAKKAGISGGTLRRAKAQLGTAIIARRDGRGWVWSAADARARVPNDRKSRKC